MSEENLKGYAIMEDGDTVKVVDFPLADDKVRDSSNGIVAKCAKCNKSTRVYPLIEDKTKARSIHKC